MDNANLIGLDKRSVQVAVDEVERGLRALGLVVHEKEDASDDLTVIGIDFCGSSRRLRLTQKRAWRLHQGLLDFCRWRKAPGWIVRILVGHVVVLRWGMSVLERVYRFTADHLNDWVLVPDEVKEEVRQAAWLVLIAEVDLGRECSDLVHCTDASEDGSGLLETSAQGSEVRAALRCRGR